MEGGERNFGITKGVANEREKRGKEPFSGEWVRVVGGRLLDGVECRDS